MLSIDEFRKNNSKIINYLFYIGILVYSFSRIYQYSLVFDFDSTIKSIIRILSLVLMIPKILLQKYEKKDFPMVIGMYGLSFICIAFGADKNIVLIPTVLVGMKNLNINTVIIIVFYVTLSSLIIHLIAFVIDYGINNKNILTMFHFSSKDVKNTIMYRDNNMYAIRYACCLMQYIYLTNRDKDRILKIVVLSLLSIFVFLISQSRTSFIISILLIMYLVFEKNKFFNRTLVPMRNIVCVFSVVVSCLFTMVGGLITNPICNKINSLLSSRPWIYFNAVDYIGITLFPNLEKFSNISKSFGRYMTPDNSYISTILKWGILISLLILLIVFFVVFKYYNSNIVNYYVMVISIWFIVEFISMEIVMYIVPLICSNMYFSNSDNS